MEDSIAARRSIAVFFACLLLLSAVGYWCWIALHQHLPLIFAPALAALATRVIRREGFGDIAFRWPAPRAWRWFGLAILLPLLTCLIAYGSAWLAGLVAFAPARLPAPFPTLADSHLHFAWTILLAATVVTAFFLPLAAGEEIGWRGHLLPRLRAAGVPLPEWVTAVVWAAWHVPLILLAAYGPAAGAPLPAAALFMVSATAYGLFLARLRLASGSIWPCILAHASWNALTQACFNPAVKPGLWPWLGESGLLTAGVLAIVVAITLRRTSAAIG